MATAVTSRRR